MPSIWARRANTRTGTSRARASSPCTSCSTKWPRTSRSTSTRSPSASRRWGAPRAVRSPRWRAAPVCGPTRRTSARVSPTWMRCPRRWPTTAPRCAPGSTPPPGSGMPTQPTCSRASRATATSTSGSSRRICTPSADPARPRPSMSLEVRRTDEGLELELTGEWVAQRVPAIESGLAAVDLAAARQVSIATQRLSALDLSGAWALRQLLSRARAAGVAVSFRGPPPDQLRLLEEILADTSPAGAPAASGPPARQPLTAIGRNAVLAGRDLLQGLAFVGRASTTLLRGLARPRRLRPISIARHVYDTGLTAVPGGALLCRYLLDMPLTQYASRVTEAISSTTFWVGLVKAPVFAVLIALAGCYRGLQVRESARELGRLVTVAVVQAIFCVILADALFAVLFMEMDV